MSDNRIHYDIDEKYVMDNMTQIYKSTEQEVQKCIRNIDCILNSIQIEK